MALTAAYFTGELLIPSISGSTYPEVENLASLNAMIAKYEPKFLKLLLGETLYATYAAAIAGNPTSGIWFDLNAQIYQTTPFYQSPVANYVYYQFWKTNRTTTLTTGEQKAKSENSDAVRIDRKMEAAWNEMCELVTTIREYLDEHSTDYEDWMTDEVESFELINQWGI